jgi:hypothetical protein
MRGELEWKARSKHKGRGNGRRRYLLFELSLGFLLLNGIQVLLNNVHGEGIHVLDRLHMRLHRLVSVEEHQIQRD